MNTTLKTAWALWEAAEQGWEKGKPEKVSEVQPPKSAPKAHERHAPVQLTNGDTSGWDALEEPVDHLPKKDPDADTMQLEQALEASLSNEAFETPDMGMSALGQSLFTGAALEPDGMYQRNFCSDPPAPEENPAVPHSDASDTLVAQQRFIPKEQQIAEQALRQRMKLLANIKG